MKTHVYLVVRDGEVNSVWRKENNAKRRAGGMNRSLNGWKLIVMAHELWRVQERELQ